MYAWLLLAPWMLLVSCNGSRAPDAGTNQATRAAGMDLQPCEWSHATPRALCGEFAVYENRATRTGRMLRLPVVVLPALNGKALPDAFTFLGGGPGQGGRP